jgi:hypothetical protein
LCSSDIKTKTFWAGLKCDSLQWWPPIIESTVQKTKLAKVEESNAPILSFSAAPPQQSAGP